MWARRQNVYLMISQVKTFLSGPHFLAKYVKYIPDLQSMAAYQTKRTKSSKPHKRRILWIYVIIWHLIIHIFVNLTNSRVIPQIN